ncbi:MAG: nucleotidyltransferase family protein [Acidobacteriota bacterium]|nr:nucleotidyltransferase family protein [Acidobacteriota bacterium]
MPTDQSREQAYMDVLSRLVVLGYSGDYTQPQTDLAKIYPDLEFVSQLSDSELAEFLKLADTHHVTVRALQVLENAAIARHDQKIASWGSSVVQKERARIAHAVQFLAPICKGLEVAGAKVSVIKSLDHWPDLGSDLDLYTSGDPQTVIRVMETEFKAKQEERSWGDRLANKWNFSVPGLPEFVEIHVRYLGQTGEHQHMAGRVIERSVTKIVNEFTFSVPAPEERVLISTLQRMYRHFYFRLCDMADFSALLQKRAIDFPEVRKAAKEAGIWPGVATFLLLVSEYVKKYGGNVDVPEEVLASASSRDIRVHLSGGFLRVPMLPSAGLYGSQLLSAAAHGDLRAIFRLPLLPPLAVSALVAYRLTGSDKGIW